MDTVKVSRVSETNELTGAGTEEMEKGKVSTDSETEG